MVALFYSLQCRAAEFMLHYSQLIPDELQKKAHLHIAAEDFKDSIQAHEDLQSLTSREEFFVFVCAVYKLGVSYQAMATQGSLQQAQRIDRISMLLYEHYCSFTETILLDNEITKVITHCLNILHLSPFSDEDFSNTEGLIETQGNKGSSGTKDTQALSSFSSEISNADNPGKQASLDGTKEELVFASHEDVLKVRNEGHSVTDKLKETWERVTTKSNSSDIVSAVIHSSCVNSEKNSGDVGLTVDRCCDTVKDSRSNVTMETVDRSFVTQSLEQETASLPAKRFLPLGSHTIQIQLQGLKLGSQQRVQGNELTIKKW